jgi:hypothetical protein
MNYRLSADRGTVHQWLLAKQHSKCLAADQLSAERSKQKVLTGLTEGPLLFPPTYKLDLIEPEAASAFTGGVRPPTLTSGPFYDTSPKQRVPSWTDRILFRPHDRRMALLKYDSLMAVAESDHRPVVASFSMSLETHSSLSDPQSPQDQSSPLPQHQDLHAVTLSGRNLVAAQSPISPLYTRIGHSESQSCAVQ